ncbi:MAG: MFS transporter [Candidatus Sericytochromatia bacterium]|nr:MFS transporter [Candidatus Sericytochromatia bacterium]
MAQVTQISQPPALSAQKKWSIAFILFGMYVTFGMSWLGIVPVLPELLKALQIDVSQGSSLYSIVSLAKSIVPILAGILAARWGLTKTMRLSGALILIGLLIPFLPAYGMWIVARFIFGMGGAIWVALMGAVTMQIFEANQRPIINAFNGVAVNIGIILALQLTLPLSASLGWKNTLALYSLLSGLFLLGLFAVGPLAPAPAKAAKGEAASNAPKAEGPKYLDTLKMPVTWIVSLSFAGPLALYLVLNYWLPIYFQEVSWLVPAAQGLDEVARKKMIKGEINQLMSWLNLWGCVSSIATGFLLQRFKKTKPFILAAALLLPVASLMALQSSNKGLLTLMLALTGVGMFLSVSPLVTLLQSQPKMNPLVIGMIMGTMFSVTYILSAMAPELVSMGYKAKMPLQTLLMICCVLTLSPAIALTLPEKAAD